MSNRDAARESGFPVERTAGLAAGLGTWLLFSGIILTGTGLILLNNVLVGAAIATLASYTAARPTGGSLPAIVAPGLLVLLGAWTIAAVFVLEGARVELFWSNVVVGALVAILAVASVYGSYRLDTGSNTGAPHGR